MTGVRSVPRYWFWVITSIEYWPSAGAEVSNVSARVVLKTYFMVGVLPVKGQNKTSCLGGWILRGNAVFVEARNTPFERAIGD
jgi:hypothetical protein